MTDRERLIELLNDKQYHGNSTKLGVNYIQNSELADYLIEYGVIVPPCKVGDTLYCESASKGQITYLKAPDLEWIVENRENFGKEIFLTREEAEKR